MKYPEGRGNGYCTECSYAGGNGAGHWSWSRNGGCGDGFKSKSGNGHGYGYVSWDRYKDGQGYGHVRIGDGRGNPDYSRMEKYDLSQWTWRWILHRMFI